MTLGTPEPKGVFFRKCDVFFKSPNLQKNIFQKTILSLKFKFPANYSILCLAGNLNFKLRIVFWNIFLGGFGDLKNTFMHNNSFIATV